jgi:hypothetical protein
VLLVLPAATGDDVARVTAQTQVIAVWTPNDASTQGKTWADYTTTVACIQQRTGLDFFAPVDDPVETAIEGDPCPNSVYLPIVVNQNGDTPVTPTPTPPSGSIAITSIMYAPITGATDEYVVIRNSGGSAMDMTTWTLRDAANHVYTFPSFALAAGTEVKVWTKAGTNTATDLYWGSSQAIWNNTGGDTAILQNAGGTEITRYSYP